MKFSDVLSRITGFTTPIFGVSWNPTNVERDAVRKLVLLLEDHRVLYNPIQLVDLKALKEALGDSPERYARYAGVGTGAVSGILPFIPMIAWATGAGLHRAVEQALTQTIEERQRYIRQQHLEIFSSVQRIREEISDVLQSLPEDTKAFGSLRSMRAACRRFLDNDPSSSGDRVAVALGELRGVFGTHLALLAVQYGIDIEGDLSSILPPEDREWVPRA